VRFVHLTALFVGREDFAGSRATFVHLTPEFVGRDG
jgi:hypothetical protein